MPVVLIHQGAGLTRESYEETVRKLTDGKGVHSPADWPVEGLLTHTAGEADGGFRVVDVWESEEAMNDFRDNRLFPAIKAAVGELPSQPKIQVHEVYDLLIP